MNATQSSAGTEPPSLGIIGCGNIGGALARLATAAEIDVVLANSRGPESLSGLVSELGPLATAGTVEDAAKADVVIVSVPLLAERDLPPGLLDGRIVLDTSNYYPFHDGRVAELDGNEKTTSELVSTWLPGARLTKAFNNILAHHIPQLARPSTASDRSALPIASDDAEAKRVASELVDRLGFDTVDAGSLAESWRFEPESAAYTLLYVAEGTPAEQIMSSASRPRSAAEVRAALDEAQRVDVEERILRC